MNTSPQPCGSWKTPTAPVRAEVSVRGKAASIPAEGRIEIVEVEPAGFEIQQADRQVPILVVRRRQLTGGRDAQRHLDRQ